MGNSKSDPKKQFQVRINHPRFTKSKIITSHQEKYLQTSFAMDQKEYDKWKLIYSKINNIPQNLLLPVKSSFSRTAMCGHTGNAIVDYHNHPYLLTEEITDRRGKKSKFTEVQVWFLLYSLVRARNQAYQLGQKLVDIRPNNIFLNQDGRIRVASSLSWPHQISNIQKAMDKEPTYISPEDLERVSRNEYFEGPEEISQAFSIGLTALSVGNMTGYEDLYNLKVCEFDAKRLDEQLLGWRFNSSFSQVLRGTVSLLCSMNPQRRMTVTELNDLLLKHHESINNKVNFIVDNAPQKLHEEIMYSRQLAGQMQPRQVSVPVQYAKRVEVPPQSNGQHFYQRKVESPPQSNGQHFYQRRVDVQGQSSKIESSPNVQPESKKQIPMEENRQ